MSSVVQMTPEVCSNEVSQSGRILDKCARSHQSHHNQLIVSFPPRHHQRAGQVRLPGLSSTTRQRGSDWTLDITLYFPLVKYYGRSMDTISARREPMLLSDDIYVIGSLPSNVLERLKTEFCLLSFNGNLIVCIFECE